MSSSRHSFDTGGAHRPQALSRHGRRARSVETESTAPRQTVVEFPINLVGPFRDASTMQSNAAVERLSARASAGAQIAIRCAVAFLIGPLRWEYKAWAAEISSASAVFL